MEPRADSEIQRPELQATDQLRAVQREKILHDHFKNPSARELLGALIPSDRPRPNTAVDAALLRQFAELLGKDTHTVLFGLAATSKNPMELQNTLFNIANLKNVKSLYWNFEESENHFLKRKLSKHLNVSEGAVNQAESLLADRKAMDKNSNTQNLLESFLYVMSAENAPPEVKRRILSDFYSAKALIPDSSGTKPGQKAYGLGNSFWSHVDGSWIDPDLAPVSAPKGHVGQPKKPSIVSDAVNDINSRLNRFEEEITQAPRITTLEGLLKKSNAKVAQLSENTQDLQGQLDAKSTEAQRLQSELNDARIENQDLGRRLREAKQQARATRSPGGQAKKSPFEILKIPTTSTSDEIRDAFRHLVIGLHPDVVKGALQNAGTDAKVVDQIGQLANDRLQEVNGAYDELKKMGKVQ